MYSKNVQVILYNLTILTTNYSKIGWTKNEHEKPIGEEYVFWIRGILKIDKKQSEHSDS